MTKLNVFKLSAKLWLQIKLKVSTENLLKKKNIINQITLKKCKHYFKKTQAINFNLIFSIDYKRFL